MALFSPKFYLKVLIEFIIFAIGSIIDEGFLATEKIFDRVKFCSNNIL